MKKVIIMRSPSGGGKSTKARELKKSYEDLGMSASIHSTDDLFIQNNVYKFDPSKIKDNHDQNFYNFRNSLRNGVNVVIVDNTNITPFEYERYVNEAKSNGYQVDFSQFGRDFGVDDSGNKLTADQLKERVRLRAQKDPSAATPPENVIDMAYNRYKIINETDYENDNTSGNDNPNENYRQSTDEADKKNASDICINLFKRSNNDERRNRLYSILKIISN